MKQSSSSNSETLTHLDSPHSPLRVHSPFRSNQGDLNNISRPYASPVASPVNPHRQLQGTRHRRQVHPVQYPSFSFFSPFVVASADYSIPTVIAYDSKLSNEVGRTEGDNEDEGEWWTRWSKGSSDGAEEIQVERGCEDGNSRVSIKRNCSMLNFFLCYGC
ncbi:hypothetical protein PTKIN_Ptkin14bG0082800 [Pterospermum kingtungense]